MYDNVFYIQHFSSLFFSAERAPSSPYLFGETRVVSLISPRASVILPTDLFILSFSAGALSTRRTFRTLAASVERFPLDWTIESVASVLCSSIHLVFPFAFNRAQSLAHLSTPALLSNSQSK